MGGNKILLVIDMQKDFVTGSLGSEEAVKIVPAVKNKIIEYENEKRRIIFTKDTHSKGYLGTQEGRNLPVEHCIKSTAGWEICDELLPYSKGRTVFEKNAFGSRDLAEALAGESGISEIELVGLCTDICVISNAVILKAFLPEVKITVDAACCAGVTPQSHRRALEAMKMLQVDVINEL